MDVREEIVGVEELHPDEAAADAVDGVKHDKDATAGHIPASVVAIGRQHIDQVVQRLHVSGRIVGPPGVALDGILFADTLECLLYICVLVAHSAILCGQLQEREKGVVCHWPVGNVLLHAHVVSALENVLQSVGQQAIGLVLPRNVLLVRFH